MASSFYDLSPRIQAIATGALSVLMLGASWQVVLSPQMTTIAEQRARLSTLEGEVARAQALSARLPAAEREVRALEASLRETAALLPEEKDPQDVLRSLHDLASESLLDIASFKPKAVVSKTQYTEWPIEIGFEGRYHDLGRFLARVASMSRFFSVSDFKIQTKTKPNGRGSVAATCVATTFVFREDMAVEAPAPATAAAPAAAPPEMRSTPSLIPVGTRVGTDVTASSGYDDEGGRDPFLSLLIPRLSTNLPDLHGPGARPRSGLAAVPVADIVVRGITRAGTRMMAILEAPDRKSYVVDVQDKLLDGAIKTIDANGVVFVDQTGDEVRKTLRPMREAIR